MTDINTNTESNPKYEKDGRGDLTQKGWLDRERDRATVHRAIVSKDTFDWKKYVEDWEEKLSGYAFPQVPIKNEEDMQKFVSEIITAIAKMFTRLDGKSIDWKYDVAKMAFNQAMNFMGELGY